MPDDPWDALNGRLTPRESKVVYEGTAGDFMRQHVAQWPCGPEHQIAWESWEAYDKDATSRELWFARAGSFNRGRLPAPRMEPFIDEESGRPVRGFEGLYEMHVQRGFEKAQEQGYEGTGPEFRQLVRSASMRART